MATLKASSDRVRLLKRMSLATVAEGRKRWRQVDTSSIVASWQASIPRLIAVIAGAQLVAGQTADEYAETALSEQGLSMPPESQVNPYGLVGVASDGRSLDSLLIQPALVVLGAIALGEPTARSMQLGYVSLESALRTQVSDAFRAADSVAFTNRRVTTYVRVLTPPSCSRCVVLAGSDYAWSTAFRRHPGCDCLSLPTTKTRGMDQRTDPKSYFESLSVDEQDRIFTKAGAQAIRDGADIGQVVNARRRAAGMTPSVSKRLQRRAKEIGVDTAGFARQGRGQLQTVNVLGDEFFVTLEGKPLQLPGGGSAPRLMPESIYQIARDRDHAIALLKRHGYIFDRPQFLPGPDGRLIRIN